MNESIVRRLWLAGSWPAGVLRATDGTPLQVIYPGRPGHGAGPDLLDAIVALPDATLLRGDVELHGRASDWRAHGHGRDRRYARVILHVVWRDDLGAPIEMPMGESADAASRQPLTVAFAQLAEPLLFERLSRPTAVEERYHDWLRSMDDGERGQLLERLGDERLAGRALGIAADLHALGPAETLHRRLLDALGYSQNRRQFGRLAELLPSFELAAAARAGAAAEARLLGLLLGAAGLLDESRLVRLPLEARAVAAALATDVPHLARMAAGEWEMVGVRPANRPARRLAALARLLARTGGVPLYEMVLAAVEPAEPRLAARRLLELVLVPGEAGGPADYWAWHHDLGRRLPGAPLALLGRDRGCAVLANVLLPFAMAVADASDDELLADRVRAIWLVAPAAGTNWVAAEMRAVLGRAGQGGARRQQGALELYRRCCAERRCLNCPSGAVLSSAPG